MSFFQLKHRIFSLVFAALTAFMLGGCSLENMDEIMNADTTAKTQAMQQGGNSDDYYNKFYGEVTRMNRVKEGTKDIQAIDALPKDPFGNVNWTVSVLKGYINPRPSLDTEVVDDPPLNLNVFIEAKVPLMYNVIFPHSIHTYWLSCNNCHPKIFLPEAGANPISMEEIFKGQWCGRCHGKVAFNFWPRSNCLRCHMVPKGQSLERERYK